MFWFQVKGHVTFYNKSFKLRDVRDLLQEATSKTDKEKQKGCVKHVIEKVEKEIWEMDSIVEDTIESVVINFGEIRRVQITPSSKVHS